MKHELKIWPQFYSRVADGTKTFEVRDNDRDFQKNDTVILKEWDPTPINITDKTKPRGFTDSPPLEFTIGYIHILSSSQVIFSLIPIKKAKAKSS